MIALMLILLFFFMLLGFPMFFGMIIAPVAALFIFEPQAASTMIMQQLIKGVSGYTYLCVPMFILAAEIMAHGQMADRLLAFVDSLVRHLPGGLAVTTGGACTIFGAVSGSTQATLVAIGKPMMKPMLRTGYDVSHIIALLMCNANIALLIPPSIIMLMFCVCTGESVGELFMAGIAPGLLLFLVFALYDVIYARVKKIGLLDKFSWKNRGVSFVRAIPALGFPVLVLGGIYSGIFSPTESAAAAVAYSLILEGLLYRSIKPKDIIKIGKSTAITCGAVYILISGGQVFSWVLSYAAIPQMFSNMILSAVSSPTVFLILISVFFFVACMFMDPVPVIIIMAPILYPTSLQLGVDPIHLGIIITLQSAIGCITPPFGCNIFTACAIFKKDFSTCIRGLAPYLILYVIVTAILIAVPDLCMLSRNLFYGG